MPITVRYNFETNSSSMHSLSIRRTNGKYTYEDLRRSDSMVGELCQDAILILDDARIETVDEIKKDLWIRNDHRVRISDYEMMFRRAPMEVLCNFDRKLSYALANAYETDDDLWESKMRLISDALDKMFPDVNFQADGTSRGVGTNDNMLFEYLEKHGIPMEEFLTNRKYVVVVNYAEYCKMKWLNMVDESAIVDLYVPEEHKDVAFEIKDGVWSPAAGDLCFGRAPFRVLGTVEGKARYAIASRGPRVVDEVLEIMQEVYPDLKRIQIPRSKYNPDEEEYGYCDDSALPTNIPLRDFILDKRYVIIADGDEYCVWDEFKMTKLFNHNEYPDEEIEEDDF